MKTIRLISVIALISQLLISCRPGPSNFEGGTAEMSNMKMMDVAGAPVPLPDVSAEDRGLLYQPDGSGAVIDINTITNKIIKDGRMEITVEDLEYTKRKVDSLVRLFKAYYADETYTNMDFSQRYNLRIRIPYVGFEAFIDKIESGIGEVTFKNITSRDVTEEFIDLETRLQNKSNYLLKYNELLKKAKTVKDILEIEEKIRLIQEEIESVQGRLKFLNNQVDFSALDLQISKKPDLNEYSRNRDKFIERLKVSLTKGWYGLVSFTLLVIKFWPFWIIAGGLLFVFMRIRRRRKKINK
jgi:hypothetical protein